MEHASPSGHTEQVAKSRVLLVEDEPAVRDATGLLLKVSGYEVVAVASLAEALERARDAGGVNLLVTDYHLCNGETGTQVIAALREVLGKQLKAVLVTGDIPEDIKDLPRDSCLRVASKPIKAEQLLRHLRELLTA